jgi:sugar phosphate isomerase/epimerase
VPWAETALALPAALELGCSRVVVLAGRCRVHPAAQDAPGDAGALRRVLEPLAAEAASHGITTAIEFPRAWSPDAIVDLLESIEDAPVGVYLDVGHAHLAGGAPETIEALSGYLVTVHAHDNQGRDDQHRLPYSGSVDWPATLMSLWKTGYSGPVVFEAAPDPDAAATLARAVGARTRLQAILDDLAQPMVFPE